jgi:outer membrane protein OmpA-like peptidoglycan-associated protein
MADSTSFTIKETAVNSGYGDFCPAFYEDGIVFASKRKSTGFVNNKYGWDNSFFIDMYSASKVKKGSSDLELNKTATILKTNEFKAKPHDGPVTFNKNFTKAFITRNDVDATKKDQVVKLMLYEIEKDAQGQWTNEKPFIYNSKDYSVGHASLSHDGKTLYFVSDMPGGMGGADIYYSQFQNGIWSFPTNAGKNINTDGDDLFPYISANGNLYYASNGKLGMGGLDVFKSENKNGSFSASENMGYPLNTNADDFSLIVDSLEENGYLSSNRIENIDRIYSVKISPTTVIYSGKLLTEKSNKAISNNPVKIVNTKTKEVTMVTTDESGKFTIKMKKGNEYELLSEKKYYVLKNKEVVKTANIKKGDTLTGSIYLQPTAIFLLCHVEEEGTKKVLPGATVAITNLKTGEKKEYMVDQLSDVEVMAERFNDYHILAKKKGYFDKEVKLTTGDFSMDEVLDLGMSRIDKGDILNIENIYYDLAKWDLRNSSQSELDKLAKFLMENDIKVELSSHTDSRASDKYNLTLSQKRAQSCVTYLISKGVSKDNIIAKGYGESKPVNGCTNGKKCSEEEHQANRRTELKILEVQE